VAVLALATAALLSGCSGSDSKDDATSRIVAGDLDALIAVSPEAMGWTWNANLWTRFSSAVGLAQAAPQREIEKAVLRAQAHAGFVRGGMSRWEYPGRQASSFASVYGSSDDARDVVEAERRFAHAWFPQVEGHVVEDVDVDIGDESWAIRGNNYRASFVEIGWARGNAVFSVYVNCLRCASAVAGAAERWAKAIDEAARTASS